MREIDRKLPTIVIPPIAYPILLAIFVFSMLLGGSTVVVPTDPLPVVQTLHMNDIVTVIKGGKP